MEREIIKLHHKVVKHLAIEGYSEDDVYEMVEDKIVDTDKYCSFHEGVICRISDSKFFKLKWSESERDIEFKDINDNEIKCTQVFEKEKVIKYYE